MSDIVLLGAGASAEAGIPTAIGMTEKMLEHFKEPGISQELKVLNFVIGGLLFKSGIEGNNPLNGINIEDVFSAIQLLGNRNSLEIFPFVGQWHPFIDELEKNHSKLSNRLGMMKDCSGTGSFRKFVSELDDVLEEIQCSSTGYIFERTNRFMLSSLTKMVWLNDVGKVEYLRPLVKYVSKLNVTVASLNYDNTIELIAGASGIKVETGINTWLEKGTFEKPNSGIELLKLHGSIDWEKATSKTDRSMIFPQTTIKTMETERLKKLADADMRCNAFSNHSPGIIFGTGNKLKSEGPFLELFRTFKIRLEESDHLISIGYSFRDEHINELIYGWLNRKNTNKLTIITRQDGKALPPNRYWGKFCYESKGRCKILNIGAKKAIESLFV